MANTIGMMDHEFESKKNWKATSYTAAVVAVMLVIFIFWKWPLGSFANTPIEEGIEVNLGNSEQGFGEDQPLLPGKPAHQSLLNIHLHPRPSRLKRNL